MRATLSDHPVEHIAARGGLRVGAPGFATVLVEMRDADVGGVWCLQRLDEVRGVFLCHVGGACEEGWKGKAFAGGKRMLITWRRSLCARTSNGEEHWRCDPSGPVARAREAPGGRGF